MALPVLQIGTHLLYFGCSLLRGVGVGRAVRVVCVQIFWLEFFHFKMHLLTNEGVHVHCTL